MGSFSSKIYIPFEAPTEVRFDLRGMSLGGAYSFGGNGGTMKVPLGLSVRALDIDDPVALAREETEESVSLPVGAEVRRRLDADGGAVPLGLESPDVVAQLISGGGVVIAVKREEGPWAYAGRLDSDLGHLLVYGRVSQDLKLVLRLETQQASGWFGRGGCFFIGRAEGSVQCSVKVRFETAFDRRLSQAKAAMGVVSVGALVSFLIFFLRKKRFRPRYG